jgi:hypothetical protein
VASLRIATLLLVVGMLLLPPRWCCAMPGIGPECCAACVVDAEGGESCCACKSTPTEKPKSSKAPCNCVCHGQTAQLDKSIKLDTVLIGIPYLLPADLVASATVAPCSCAVGILPPDDVQSRLCRWLI